MAVEVQTYLLEAETRELLNLMVHSLYTGFAGSDQRYLVSCNNSGANAAHHSPLLRC